MPIEGQPADVHRLLTDAHAALKISTDPKLVFVGDSGAIVSPAFARQFAANQHNIRTAELEPGFNYLQEDHAARIGEELHTWIDSTEVNSKAPEIADGGVSRDVFEFELDEMRAIA